MATNSKWLVPFIQFDLFLRDRMCLHLHVEAHLIGTATGIAAFCHLSPLCMWPHLATHRAWSLKT
jgi:hypothetical protein